ncbi:MAG: cyanophycinase [Pseudomonadota bacterium]
MVALALWLLLACRPSALVPDSRAPGDTGAPPVGVVVLAGGGTEGEVGEPEAWSAQLYRPLLVGGDVTGDGRITVLVLSAGVESDWLPGYFRWLGADESFNLQISSRDAASDPALADTFAAMDAVFLKGGDQGVYYDLWNDTLLEEQILGVWARGGGLGGTSAGAMSLAGHALAGGKDLVSADVLADACTEWLADASDGGSAVHDDFLGVLPEVLIDTHFTERGRLGRLAGAMAREQDERAPERLLGIGIEAETGLVVRDGLAEVLGVGSVAFVRPRPGGSLRRDCGEPLVYTDLSLDLLTEGWIFDLEARAPDRVAPPADAEPVAWDGILHDPENGVRWCVKGAEARDEQEFGWMAKRGEAPFFVQAGERPPLLVDTLGILRADDEDARALGQEALFRALYELPGVSGLSVSAGAFLVANETGRVGFYPESPRDAEVATLVIDTRAVDWRSLSPVPSRYDGGDGSLHAAGLLGLTLHVLSDSMETGLYWDTQARAVVR